VSDAAPSGQGLRLVNGTRAVRKLRDVGVRVAGIANNHAGDAGGEGERQSVQALGANAIVPTGGAAGPASFAINGVRFVAAAYDLTNGVPDALEDDLRTIQPKADHLIVSFHVTGAPDYLPRPELRKAVELAVTSGAQVIVAHGTHVVGPVERRGSAVIAWGLGNLVFACDCTKETEGIVLRVSFGKDGVERARVIPIQAGLQGEPAKPSPDPSGVFDLLEAIGSSKLVRHGYEAEF
jgi:poly-gamma-glutamate capsule biosynthesis protein CapA/YwtB (metallophosphatase superfamily)